MQSTLSNTRICLESRICKLDDQNFIGLLLRHPIPLHSLRAFRRDTSVRFDDVVAFRIDAAGNPVLSGNELGAIGSAVVEDRDWIALDGFERSLEYTSVLSKTQGTDAACAHPDTISCISRDFDIMTSCSKIFCFHDVLRGVHDFCCRVSQSSTKSFKCHVYMTLTSWFAGIVLVPAVD